jgi:hypothetical protein
MEAELDTKLQINEGLLDDEDDDEGCVTELMALVVVDEFPIEVRYHRVTVWVSLLGLTDNTRPSTRSSKTTKTRPMRNTSGWQIHTTLCQIQDTLG